MTRRDFLHRSGYAGFAAGPLSTWGSLQALSHLGAQGTGTGPTDYRALVCVFLAGGNDSFGMLVPAPSEGFSSTGWAATNPSTVVGQQWQRYQAQRGPLAVNALFPAGTALKDAVLPLYQPGGSSLHPQALHGRMPRLQAIFNGTAFDGEGTGQDFTPSGRHAAFIQNVGTLVEPVADGSVAELRQGLKQRPKQLQSHNDQILQWQTCFPQGSSATGWAGRIADLAFGGGGSGNQYAMVSLDGVTPALIGYRQRHFTDAFGNGRVGLMLDGGAYEARRIAFQGLLREQLGRDPTTGAAVPGATVQQTQVLSRAYASTLLQGLDDTVARDGLIKGTPAPPALLNVRQDHGLTAKLRRVAHIIKAARSNTAFPRRQIFFVTLGGWDHHNGAGSAHFTHLDILDQALAEFYAQLQALNALNAVTLFTASDFGRALLPNGDGTDHAWGGHQIVLGGAVNGGQLYGQYPQLSLALKDNRGVIIPASPGRDLTGNGTFIPSLAVDQYMQRLAQWFLTGVVDLTSQNWDPTGNISNWTTVLPNWEGFRPTPQAPQGPLDDLLPL